MSIRIQWRRGTAAKWTSANPTLANGEAGFENDTGKFKIGDGATAWSDLEYTGSAADVAAAQASAQSASDSADAALGSESAAALSASAADGAAQARVQELRDDLADPTGGAGLVKYDGRSVGEKLSDTVSAKDSQFAGGAKGDGVTDDTAAVQQFLDYVGNPANAIKDADLSGVFRISAPLVYNGNSRTTTIRINAVLLATGANPGYVLSLINCTQGTFVGSLEVLGPGDVAYATRTWGGGVYIQNSSRSSFAGRITVRNFLRWGVRITSSVAGGTGNSSMTSLGNLRALNCGPRLGDNVSVVSARSNTGSSGSSGQRTLLTLDNVPATAEVNDIIMCGGHPHIVTAIAGSNVTVFPWVDSAVTEGSSVSWVDGGGLYITGADANLIDANLVDASNCGIGFRPVGFFQGPASRVVSQNCTIGIVTGNGVSSGSFNLHLQNPYFEINDLNWVNTSYSPDGILVTADLGLDATWGKVIQLGPRDASGAFTPSLSVIPQAMVVSRGEVLTRSPHTRPDGTSAASSTIELGYSPGSVHSIRGNTPTITLKDQPGKRRLFGYVDLHIFIAGTGTNRQPTGTVTVNPEAGFTINGASNYVLTGLTTAVMLQARLVGTNWEVARYNGHAAATRTYTASNVTTDRAFDAATATAGEIANVLGTLIEDLRERGLVL